MRNIIFVFLIGFISLAEAQSNNILYPIKDRKTGCIFYSIRKDTEFEWDGNCENGYLNGLGKLNIFSNNELVYISKGTLKAGKINGEYFDTSLIDKFTIQGSKINGLKNGLIVQKYYKKNSVVIATEFNMGLIDGKQTLYYDCDTCTDVYDYKGEFIFKNDKLIERDNFYRYLSNGRIIIQTVLDLSLKRLPVPITWINPGVYKLSGVFSDELNDFAGDVTIEWENGVKYVGRFSNNKKNGYGTQYYTNGNIYRGYWKDDMAYGDGTLSFGDGFVLNGKWENDKLLSGILKDKKNNNVPFTFTNNNGTLSMKYGGDKPNDTSPSEEVIDWGSIMKPLVNFMTNSITGEVKPKDCLNCKGAGVVKVCKVCSERGTVHCRECRGKGYDRDLRTCLKCSGSGITRCHACNGRIYNIKCQHSIWQFQR